LLDEQFSINKDYYTFVNKSFIPVRLAREKGDEEIFTLYKISATPTVVVIEADGKEIDRIIGYDDPPSIFLKQLTNAYNRTETLEKLQSAYEKNPDDLINTFKLGYKMLQVKFDRKKITELFTKVYQNSDEARKITIEYDIPGELVNLYEWTLYQLGMISGISTNFKHFFILLKEYPDSRFAYSVYETVSKSIPATVDSTTEEWFFDSMLEKYPDNLKLLMNYVNHYTQTGKNTEKALKAASKVTNELEMIVISPFFNMNKVYNNYAKLLEKNGDEDILMRVYGTLYLRLTQGFYEEALMNYIRFWAAKGGNEESVDKALTILTTVNAFRVSAYIITNFVTNTYITMGKMDKALEFYGPSFLKKNWDNASEIDSYAYYWAEKGENLPSALEAIARYEELEPDQELLNLKEKIYFSMGDTIKARKYGEEYIELYKNNPWYLESYARDWADKGKNLDNALKACKTGLAVKNDNVSLWFTLSTVYWKMENYEEALKAADKTREIYGVDNPAITKQIENIKADMARIKKK
jgi:tetratricopeptide (TPR) repeat protein